MILTDLLMAEDGPSAIELVQKHEIDVAVLDIRMAGMSGIEVLERLKYVNPNIETFVVHVRDTRRAAGLGAVAADAPGALQKDQRLLGRLERKLFGMAGIVQSDRKDGARLDRRQSNLTMSRKCGRRRCVQGVSAALRHSAELGTSGEAKW